ncbi:MAG: PTS system mannose/fructose/sorbose family transporter subunit IID [Bacteroidales bacterium]|jgi:PTS system mannose-specific IID component|nr:PTS system mannose/fructose/sorbose family transporter subunit IID [Bacteroidales bacterium]
MTVEYLLITAVVMFGHMEDFLGAALFSRPLVLGPLVGLALGDPVQGIIIGATLELIFMGNIKVGAAIPPDVITGGALGTAFAIMSGNGAEIALAIAIPVSIIAEIIISGLFVVRPALNSRFEKYAAEGNFKKIEVLHVASGLTKPLLMGTLAFLALQLGDEAMQTFLNSIPAWVQSGLSVAGSMLPAVGFAMLMNLMFNKHAAVYFFLGFILASYLKLPMIAIGALGIIIAIIITGAAGNSTDSEEYSNDDEQEPVADRQITKRDLRKVFFRSLALEANFNFETWQNTGFAYSIIPVLKKLYHTKEQMSSALRRHLQFFNTTAHGSTLILGITAAMEEQNSTSGDFDTESINAVKSGLMGPLAGVFDSLFWGTLKVIAAGIGVSLAMDGNMLGPLLFILIFNIPHFSLRYYMTFAGYNTGNRFLQNLARSGIMAKLTSGATILGLMVIGAMPVILMPLKTPITIGTQGSEVSLQMILDQLAPGLLSLALTFFAFWLVRRNIKTTWILLGILVLGFVGSILNIFI